MSLSAGAIALGTGISAGGNILGGMLSGKQNYKYSRKLQEHQFNFEREMFNKNTELANTAHQREITDLKNAGLNPVLSAMGGNGAPMGNVPGGNAGTISGSDTNPNLDLISAMTAVKQLEKTNAEINNIDADTKQKNVTTSTLPELNQSIIDFNNANTGKARQEKRNLVAQEVFQNTKNEILDIEKDINYGTENINVKERKEIVRQTINNKMKALEIQAKKLGMNNSDWKIVYDTAMGMIDNFIGSWSPLVNGMGGGNEYNFNQSVPTVNYAN